MAEDLMEQIPVLPLRGLAVYPHMTIQFDVGRPSSVKAVEEAMRNNAPIFLVTQKDIRVETPQLGELYPIGTVAKIKQILRLSKTTIRVVMEGLFRGEIETLEKKKQFQAGNIIPLMEPNFNADAPKTIALVRRAYERFEDFVDISPSLTPDMMIHLVSSENPAYVSDFIAQHVLVRMEEKQEALQELHPVNRLKKVLKHMERELSVLEMEKEIHGKTKDNLGEMQRKLYLREQMKVLKSELGEDEEVEDEIAIFRKQILDAKLSPEGEEKLLKELKQLSKQHFGSAEGSVIRHYLEVVLALPWHKSTKERIQIDLAKKHLDADHFGLEKVKTRILEFLAVKQLAPEVTGEVLCLYGPPGVGKTSIAMSMAKAMNRNLARISLGGIHDEAEIRGHRKTYVGAMAGRIMEAIRQAGSNNPIILLDEIDKLGQDRQGDPAAALLEVLDMKQNHAFRDHFIELPFDLSSVLFIATANQLNTVPRPLLDRMELIEIASYTDEEKLQIAKRHLLPKELKRHGLQKRQLSMTDDAIRQLIVAYTKESGVRILNRKLADICRKVAMKVVSEDCKAVKLTGDNLADILGVPQYYPEKQALISRVGVVNGLAFTSVGGTLLEVEVGVMSGTGKLELTGNLGNVMKESAMAGRSYIRSRAEVLGVSSNFHKDTDIHIHFPEGAVPKDGPSAGITVTLAMVSALTDRPVRGDIAMTGEVSLRGRVLPIGGLREKTMAALRNGIHTVIIPKDNEKDLEEIDQSVRKALEFIPVSHVDEVLDFALEGGKEEEDLVCSE